MASPANSNQQQSQQPFDMQKFFKPTNPSTPQNPNPNLSSTPFTIPPSSYPPPPSGPLSYPPQTLPFHHQFQYHPPSPRSHHQIPFSQEQLPSNFHQQRSLSYPTPPLQPPNYNIAPPQNNFNSPNSGARIMALLGAPSPNMELSNQSSSGVHDFSGASSVSVVPTIPMAINPTAPIRMPSSKLPKGRHLIGDHVMYDVDVRLQGEVQPQLEVTPITKYASDPQLVLGRQIAVNKSYICYGLKQGNIRVLNIHTALRSLFRGHTLRVTDMDFFAEDVHLLASVSIEGRVFVWKISEGPDEEGTPQITGTIVLAMHILGEGDALHPRLCWHCHKQEVLVVGLGKHILRIDTTKVAKTDVCSGEEPLKCPVDKLIDGVQLVGKHEGEVTDLSMCQWMTTRLVSASTDGTVKIWEDRKSQPLMVIRPHDGHPVNAASFLTAPHRPDHIILITCGPLNREVKIWASTSDEGWLLPSDAESWKCTQTLDLKCSSESRIEEAFFNQVVALPQAGLLLLANAKRNAIYAVHLEYGSNPLVTRMDYIAEFTVTMPILSFTGTSIFPHGEHIIQVYCVQTQAIQQYALDLSQCLPSPLENAGLDKSDSFASRHVTGTVGVGAMDSSKLAEIPNVASVMPTIQVCTTESANSLRYPVSSNPAEAATSKEFSTRNANVKPVGLTMASSDADVACVPSPSLPLSPRLSGKLSGLRSPMANFEPGSLFIGDHAGEQPVNDYSVDQQIDPVRAKISDVPKLDYDSKNDEKVAQDELSGVLNPSVMFKQPTHLITPSEILRAASSSEATHTVEGKGESEKNIQDMTVNGDIGNTELEVKVIDKTKSTQNDEFGSQRVTPTVVSESRDKYFCSQASDLGLDMARDSFAICSERYIDDEASQADGARNTEPVAQPCLAGDVDHDSVRDVSEKGLDSSMPTLSSKAKKQKGKSSQACFPSPSQSAVNLLEHSTEAGGSLSLKAASSQILTMQETLNQILNMQKEMQKQMTMMVAAPVTKEGKRLEAALGRGMEKVVKANNDALWTRFQEENVKNDKLLRERFQQITSLIGNFLNKDLQSLLEKTLRKEIASVGTSVVRTITPTIEKTISSAIVDAFQRGVGDKAVNQLDKSVSSKLEATVARQIQAQFQTSGKQALQDALKSNFETSVIPAFEKSCKAMFEQVDSTFKKGIAEHANAAKQHFESSHSPLALALREAVNSASSVTQTLSGELADGQRKLIALAAAGANASGVNPLVTQLNNGPLGGLHEKVEVPMDPTKDLSRLITERKYEEAFTGALQRSDVTIVSWLCSQVDLRGMLSMVTLPLSQGVLLSLLQQLACDIDNDTSRKLSWMTDVAAAINPAHPMIAMHVRPIFEQVYQILHHQRSLPIMNGAELTSVRLLMHVINSMLMTCK